MAEYKYSAFISYSRKDKKIAKRLHRFLEGRSLNYFENGKKIEKTTGKIFLDTLELGAASKLSDALKQSLRESRTLIILCSYSSKKSKWVNEEILEYINHHENPQILTLIIDESDAEKVLPETLINREEGLHVFLKSDGKTRAFTKIYSELIGLKFDTVWNRDRRKRRRHLLLRAIKVAFIFLLPFILVYIILKAFLSGGEKISQSFSMHSLAIAPNNQTIYFQGQEHHFLATFKDGELRKTLCAFVDQSNSNRSTHFVNSRYLFLSGIDKTFSFIDSETCEVFTTNFFIEPLLNITASTEDYIFISTFNNGNFIIRDISNSIERCFRARESYGHMPKIECRDFFQIEPLPLLLSSQIEKAIPIGEGKILLASHSFNTIYDINDRTLSNTHIYSRYNDAEELYPAEYSIGFNGQKAVQLNYENDEIIISSNSEVENVLKTSLRDPDELLYLKGIKYLNQYFLNVGTEVHFFRPLDPNQISSYDIGRKIFDLLERKDPAGAFGIIEGKTDLLSSRYLIGNYLNFSDRTTDIRVYKKDDFDSIACEIPIGNDISYQYLLHDNDGTLIFSTFKKKLILVQIDKCEYETLVDSHTGIVANWIFNKLLDILVESEFKTQAEVKN